MNNLKVVGTRGRKRRRAFRLFAIPFVAASAVCLMIFYMAIVMKSGSALAEESGSGPGISTPDAPGETAEDGAGPSADVLGDRSADSFKSVSVDADEREISFGPIGVGPNIKTGDYIDVRLMCADGTDYVVASKKELMDYNASTGMSVIRVRESELLTLNSAMADRNSLPGITLYAVKYVDPFAQSAADISYRPNEAVSDQIRERGNETGR